MKAEESEINEKKKKKRRAVKVNKGRDKKIIPFFYSNKGCRSRAKTSNIKKWKQ